MSRLLHLSLLSGPLPVSLTIAAFAALAHAMSGAGRARWRQTALLALVSLVGVVAVGKAFGVQHKVGSSFPKTFFLWAALPVFATVLSAKRWTQWRWTRRATGGASVLLLLAFGAITINAHYAYLPTLGDALGAPVEYQLPASALIASAPDRSAHHGVVVSVTIPGTVSHFKTRDALVWLPPAYFATPSQSLPVIEMLAGVPGDPSNLLRAGHAGRVADAYADGHGGVAPILVFPDHNGSFFGDSECVDGPRGNAETYLTVDVPNYVTSEFHTTTAAHSWGIAGYSEGGTCAVTLALRHADRFAAFLDIAGDLHPNAAKGPDERRLTTDRLYDGNAREYDAHDALQLLAHPTPTMPLALFAAGSSDAHGLAVARQLAAQAQAHQVPVNLHVTPGGHTFTLVHRALVDLFPLLADDVVHAAGTSTP